MPPHRQLGKISRAVGMLATSGVSDARVGEGKWLIGMVSSGVATCGNA